MKIRRFVLSLTLALFATALGAGLAWADAGGPGVL